MYNYFPRNYEKVLEKLIPRVYIDEDLAISSMPSTDLVDLVIGAIIDFSENSYNNASNIHRNILPVSAVGTLSDIQEASGMLPYLVPGGKTRDITPYRFELEIFKPLGRSISDYDTSADLYQGIQLTFRDIRLNGYEGTVAGFDDLADTTSSAFANDASGTHIYLANSLGLFYFLNFVADVPNPEHRPYYFVEKTLAKKFSRGETVTIEDAIKDYFRYVWSVYDEHLADADINLTKLVPSQFLSGTGTYTSGTQGLDNLLTTVGIIYNKGALRDQDTYLRDAFQDYLDSEVKPSTQLRQGPFSKYLRAVSYMMGDIDEYNVKLKISKSVEECPEEYLEYLADLIGWKFYGDNISSWRRQLRAATDLYKKKGTKKGLMDAFSTVLPDVPIDLDSSISEMYESYIPNLMYYLIATESPMFSGVDSWTYENALHFNQGEFSPEYVDLNIRFSIDHVLRRAALKFPEAFTVQGYQFDLSDPDFVFNYRNRDFPIPPWEEEKFYMDCDMHEELVRFLRDEIVCLGVPDYYGDKFETYILDNTIRGYQPIKKYENTFLFFTDTIQRPPNYDRVVKFSSTDLLKFLPLWSGKSSHFDFTLSGSSFEESTILDNVNFSKEDFFASLGVVKDFTPAKSIPRVHFDLTAIELVKDADYLYPKVKYSLVDFPTSGVLAGHAYSGLDMRDDSLGLLGSHRMPSFTEDLNRTRTSHQDLPVFKRTQADYWNVSGSIKHDCYSFDADISSGPLTVSGPYTAAALRGSVRRRDFSQKLSDGENYFRNHVAGPNFYVAMDEGVVYSSLPAITGDPAYDYVALGFNNRNALFTDVDAYKLKGSVWDKCENIYSPNSFNATETSATYEIRGPLNWDTSSIDATREHFFVDRSNTSEMRALLFKLIDKKIEMEAEKVFSHQPSLFSRDIYSDDIVKSIKSDLWTHKTFTEEDYFGFSFNTWKPSCRHMYYTVHKLYDFYMRSFDYHNLSDKELDTLVDGGASIISHAYGPVLFNAGLQLDSSGRTAGILKRVTYDVADEFEGRVGLFAANKAAFDQVDREQDFVPGYFKEMRLFAMLSGVEIVDKDYDLDLSVGYTSKNDFLVLNLSDDNNRLEIPNFLHNRYSIVIKPVENFPRVRYNAASNLYESVPDQLEVPSYFGERPNKLLPEHEFTLNVSSQFLRENSNLAGGGSVGVWIHTKPELDAWGNYVFWSYTPTGKWVMSYVDDYHQKKGAPKKVKDELSHFKNIDLFSVDELICYENVSAPKRVLLSLKEEDLDVFTIKFDTKNRNIKCPVEYYQVHQQVHREDQNYIIEVFPDKSGDLKKFWLHTGVNVRDEDLYKCTFLNHEFDIYDYSLINERVEDSNRFYRSDGSQVPFGTTMRVDASGNVYEGDDKLTLAHTHYLNTFSEYPRLYQTCDMTFDSQWVVNNKIIVNLGTRDHVGYFKQIGEDEFSPSSLKVKPRDLGSSIIKSEEAHESIEPKDMMVIFRFFKSMSDDDQSRDSSLSNAVHGADGGSRLNYRIHPASYETTNTYATKGSYNTLEVTN